MSVELESDISIFNLPRSVILLGDYLQHERAIDLIGAHGLQYSIVRNFYDNDIGKQLVAASLVHSFHQSFVRWGRLRLIMPNVAG
ncbi:MAG TPA: hypothetical protein VLG47_02955, partial [Candidatus Saccharimonadales bacterium]|nr:hypothetical protein [Candidatus Saccharimonadales bacterium]